MLWKNCWLACWAGLITAQIDTTQWKGKYARTFHGCFIGIYSVLFRTCISFPGSYSDALVWLRCYSSVQESFKSLAVKGIYLTPWKLLETRLAGSFTNRWVHGYLQNQSTREMFQTSKQKLREYVTKQQLYVFIILCIPYLRMGLHSVMFCSVFCYRRAVSGGFF